MEWKLIITKTQNGYICTHYEDNDGEPPVIRRDVIQEDPADEFKDIEELLWYVMEFFGCYGSKHDPQRLRIVRQKQEG